MVQRLGLAGHKNASYALLAQLGLLALHFVLESARAGFGTKRSDGGYDNHNPRAWLAQQSGASARANAAQANSFEALPFFMGAVIVAHQLGVGQAALDLLALVYVALRLLYILWYVSDKPLARSAAWGAAFAVNVSIFFLGYR